MMPIQSMAFDKDSFDETEEILKDIDPTDEEDDYCPVQESSPPNY